MWRRERPHHLYMQATERCYGSRHFLHLSWARGITPSDQNLQRVSWQGCSSCVFFFTNTKTGSWNWDGPGNIRDTTPDSTMTWVQLSPKDRLRLTQLRELLYHKNMHFCLLYPANLKFMLKHHRCIDILSLNIEQQICTFKQNMGNNAETFGYPHFSSPWLGLIHCPLT